MVCGVRIVIIARVRGRMLYRVHLVPDIQQSSSCRPASLPDFKPVKMPALPQFDYLFAIGTIFAFLDAWNIGKYSLPITLLAAGLPAETSISPIFVEYS